MPEGGFPNCIGGAAGVVDAGAVVVVFGVVVVVAGAGEAAGVAAPGDAAGVACATSFPMFPNVAGPVGAATAGSTAHAEISVARTVVLSRFNEIAS